jgi:hypothetical protein
MNSRILPVSRAVTFLLPILAAAGTNLLPVPVFGYTLSAFRLLVPVVLLLAMMLHPSLPTTWGALPTRFAALTAFWLLFGFASLLWMTDQSLGSAELLSIALGSTVVLSLGIFQKVDPRTIDYLRRGWIFALCGMYIVVAWELVTGRHLEGTFILQNQMIYGETANLGVQGTLDNPNDLAAFFVFCVPFVLWSLLRPRKLASAIFLSSLVLSAGALTVFTGARLSLLMLTLQLIIFCYQSRRRRGRVLLVGAVALSVVVGTLLVMTATLQKLSNFASEMAGSDETPIRRNLFLNGVEFLVKSYGRGIGAGGYTGAMRQGAGSYPTSNWLTTFVNPHAGIIEVSQYGLLVLIAVLAFLFVTGRTLWRGRKFALAANRNSLYLSTQVGLVSLLGLIILSFEGSLFLTETVNWMFVASVLVLGTHSEFSVSRCHAVTVRVAKHTAVERQRALMIPAALNKPARQT